jgi:hypothetical protein
MALKGSKILTTGIDALKFLFEWEIVKQDVLNLYSTINWKVSAFTEDNGVNGVEIDELSVYATNYPTGYTNKIDSVSIQEKNTLVEAGNGQLILNTNRYSLRVDIRGYIKFGSTIHDKRYQWYTSFGDFDYIQPATVVTSVNNFTDEENPTINYKWTNGNTEYNDITKVEACISFTGGDDDIPYREIAKPKGYLETLTYTFELTEEERKTLRKGITSGSTKKIRFYIKTTMYGVSNYETRFNYADAIISLVDFTPTLAPVVRDVNTTTVALTGNENMIIKGRSNVYFETGAEAKKEAVIATQLVTNGTKMVKNLASGIIEAVESNVFIFNAVDSRGINAETATIELDVMDYTELTCNQHIEMNLINEAETEARVTISGNYFNGSFGNTSNDLKLEIRHSNNDGGMTEWADITPLLPQITDNTYMLSFNISGFDGGTAYDFQCRATDKLGTVETPVYTARFMPLFDWSEEDFHFHVPVTMDGNLTAKGDIETEGNLTVNGDVSFNRSIIINGSKIQTMHILSDTITNGVVTLNDVISNYDYIEIMYTDNNNRGYNCTKFPVVSDKAYTIDLSIVESSSANSTYIRRTAYICSGDTLTPSLVAAGYVHIMSNTFTHITGENYLKIVKVIGYK